MPAKTKQATVVIHEDRCKGCNMCVVLCPPHVLQLSPDRFNELGYHPVELLPGCTGCEMCYLVCPDYVFEVYRG